MLTRKESVMVKDGLAKVLKELRPDGLALVDAFDIPDRVLGSALGRHDGNVYEALVETVKNSPLNQSDPFDGYSSTIGKKLDKEFLKARSKL